ncbi:MAG: metalloregulator ArsR/SmtB family transcription factor [Actinomycetota bacterium]|nr:metalloregulator ArsR/SmtB family transcription factor [Actinomycetota bacterium]
MSFAAPARRFAPLTGKPMSVSEARATARLLKILSDPHRLRMVNLLANSKEAVCVLDITEYLGLSQSTTSFHLKKLMDAGLLRRDRHGTWAYYSLERDVLRRLREVFRSRR